MNSILAFLTAGRIWWIHRQRWARSNGFLESGILYPLFQVVNLVNVNFNIRAYPHPMPFDWTPIAVLSAGFAPTLVMVRAKLGKKVESLRTGESAFSDIRFNRPDIVSGSESTSRDAGGVERMRRV
ncbi:hypothetical protein VNI00_009500 [Paramarasmius palmivorus]|uniref:Uncharacterized protein n=1 Tax=Paramarasmius palmivorus TaxID=297713 RepID=A0AAW0CM55_9AGAR